MSEKTCSATCIYSTELFHVAESLFFVNQANVI